MPKNIFYMRDTITPELTNIGWMNGLGRECC